MKKQITYITPKPELESKGLGCLTVAQNERKFQVDSLFLAIAFDTVEEVERVFDILKEEGTVIETLHI